MSCDLFGRLGTAARSLLIRASVFRLPVTGPAPRPGPSLRRRGVALALAAVSVALAVEAGRALAVPHLASAEGPARAVPSVAAASAIGPRPGWQARSAAAPSWRATRPCARR
jgi:hypothetical protein